MEDRVNSIISEVERMENVKITTPFTLKNEFIYGAVTLTVSEVTLDFKVVIAPQYPFQLHEQETIKFINTDILEYNHVNADGSVCLHTAHCPELAKKLWFDFEGLFHWIKKYYVKKSDNDNYEHLLARTDLIDNEEQIFLFTDVDHKFQKGEFGKFNYALLSKGKNRINAVNTYLVQEFRNGKDILSCKWSANYKSGAFEQGIYVFVDNQPTLKGRFVLETWKELEPFIEQGFLNYLYQIEKLLIRETNNRKNIPLFIGYRIPNGETHWQCAMIEVENFPNYGMKIPGTGRFEGRLKDEAIRWVSTKNCSYNYYFGRGALNVKITESKILIIGIGAIGSIVATTLVRGGCKNITLLDYDVKEPENVCRSEYFFTSGVNLKTHDLGLQLSMISPFVEIASSEISSDIMKYFLSKDDKDGLLKDHLSQFDIIIDCTADNDVVFMLNKAEPESEVISLSITNHANQLICTFGPGIYQWTSEIFTKFNEETNDLYEPTGCWSPTFKASYNDIALLVQFAIKHINIEFKAGNPLRNFYISADEENNNLKITRY